MLLSNPRLDLPLTPEEANSINWQESLVGLPYDGEWRYMDLFARQMYLASQNDQPKEEALYALLAIVASFKLRLDQQPHPFVARVEIEPFPTPTIDALNESHLRVLKGIAFGINDPYFKARVNDVIWCKQKTGNVEFVRSSIAAYIVASKSLPASRWDEQSVLLERAIQLARGLGKNNAEFKLVITTIETRLDEIGAADEGIFAHRLMDILLRYDEGDASKYAKQCDELANVLRTEYGKWEIPCQYLQLKSRWLKKLGDESGAQQAREAAAETFVNNAEEVWHTGAPTLRANALWNLENAINAFRKIGRKDRADQLHLKYLEWQKENAKHGFGHIQSDEIDATALIEHTQNAVKGKTLHEALFALAMLSGSPKVDHLRKTIEAKYLQSPLYGFMPWVLVNSDGKRIAELPSIDQRNPGQREEVIRQAIHRHAPLFRSVTISTVIVPGRERILEEHVIRMADLDAILQYSPFVQPHQRYLFVHGLYAGLHNEMDTAVSLLVPQVENALRYILGQAGVIVSNFPNQYNEPQDELSLERIFGDADKRAKLVEIFDSEDTVFDLEGILINRWSGNLRNRFAHGLMGTGEYFAADALYFWWLTLRLCCFPVINLINRQNDETVTNSS